MKRENERKMIRNYFKITRGRISLFLTIAILICYGVMFVVNASNRHTATSESVEQPESSTPEPKAITTVPQSQPADITVELVTVHPWGFDPEEITVTRGIFLLAIDNHSGLNNLSIGLFRETGNKLREINMPRGRINWNEGVDLLPGTYVLKEASHPDWTCTITVTAH
jgi:hypothetical protein